MPIAVLHRTIDSLPESYIEKVSEYVDLLVLKLKETQDVVDEEKEYAARLKAFETFSEKYCGKIKVPDDFDEDKELEEGLREKYGFVS